GFDWHERLLYVGVVPLFAALRASGRWRWACWTAAALPVALALGKYAPWADVVRALGPGVLLLRTPSKHLGLAAMALALAAGVGLERLRGRHAAVLAWTLAVAIEAAGLTFVHWFPQLATRMGGAEKLAQPGAVNAAVTAAVPSLGVASFLFGVL